MSDPGQPPVEKGSQNKRLILIVAGVFAGVAIWSNLTATKADPTPAPVVQTSTGPTTDNAITTASPAPTSAVGQGDATNQAGIPKSAPLLIKSWHCSLESGYMKFVGEVTNQTQEAMTNIEAVGEVYDKNGLVDTAEALIDYQNLRPGETSPFSSLVSTGGRGDHCKISFKTFDGTVVDSVEAPK